MLIFQDVDGIICDVYENTTGRTDLTSAEVTDGTFDGWSKGKILCYKCTVVDGHVTMLTPCVDSRLIRNFDNTQVVTMHRTAYIGDTEVVFTGVPKGSMSVYAEPLIASYTISQDGDTVTVSFDEREEVTKVTLTII